MSNTLRQHWYWYAAGIGLVLFFWLLAPILTPFVLGAGLAYLGDPIVDRLQRWGLSRTLGVVVVFLILTLLGLIALVLVAPMLYQQSLALLKNIPDWLAWIQNVALPYLGVSLPPGVQLDVQGLKAIVAEHWSSAGDLARLVWAQISQSGALLITAAANLLLVPIVTFYLLRDWDHLVDWIRSMIPPRHLPLISRLAAETDAVMGSFVRGQFSVMMALAVLYSIGLALAGLKLALVIGFIAGMLSFVPYLGFAVGFIAAALAMLVQEQALLPLVWVALVFGAGQIIESWWLTPTLVGDRIGLHPVAVIFALMAGGHLFGFVGVLLALPGSAVIAVLLRHAKQQWLRSPLYGGGAPAAPPDTATDHDTLP
ncbi:Predicted PurR-regulated permease PerM [Fontimonas thermophila]|uniref:Predicted PurR-regulated permease PerM n=1 Tax=Fontimonas thermophila TaxID=1076937 RepID=A0A1I2INZ5_9GAMM|nr:AI-2E family transporter [Fontimonas thermophila]SFF43348.1 Predicted PurR-regulated permease PerM [Fontimonas thermophila]